MGSLWRPPPKFYRLLLLLALHGVVSGAPDPKVPLIKNPLNRDKPGPYKIYKTEPRFIPSVIKITHKPDDPSVIAPGYTFIAPHIGSNGYGPQIIDQDGELVWYGLPYLAQIPGKHVYGMDLRVCDFQGSIGDHLCWSEGRPKDDADQGVKAGGANRIFNNHYEPVTKDFTDMGGMFTPNPHEFNMLPGGESFLQTVYQPRKRDLRPYGGLKNGWVLDGCFQEIDVRFRKVLFKWCFLDHYDVWETFLYLDIPANKVNSSSGVSGKGLEHNKWDFMHENAIDKNEEGDYLVSGRHLSQLLKIAGPNSRSGKKAGETIWRLNGRHSDFELEKDALFGRQHHARFISTGQNETVVSMFNNAFDGATGATRERSAGLVLRVNNVTMKAKVEHMFEQPENRLSYAQGSTSLLPNGNYHVGWGTHAQWSEFSANNTLLYHAKAIVINNKSGKKLTNYRSFKYEWVGKPKTKPKLVPYCQSCKTFAHSPFGSKKRNLSPLVAYVSWNGATEVKFWRFMVSAKDSEGPWLPAGEFPRKGFETKAVLSSKSFESVAAFAPWVQVEAVDKGGNVLERTVSRTFVPKSEIKHKCTKSGCNAIFRFDYGPKYNQAKDCGTEVSWFLIIIVAVLLLLALESWEKMYYTFTFNVIFPTQHSPNRIRFKPIPQGHWYKSSVEKA